MKKEQVKSIILGILVLLNVFLSSQILIEKKLWPDGYNFFSHTENSTILRFFSKLFDKHDTTSISKVRITVPERIIINTGYQTTRLSLNSSHTLYSKINNDTYDILSATFAQIKTADIISSEEWYAALTGKSVYLSYTTDFDTKLYLRFMGVKDSELETAVSKISNIVIQPLSNNMVAIYLQDDLNNTYYKMISSNCPNMLEETIDSIQDSLQEKAETSDNDTSMVINYSFDLFFDKAFGTQRVILDPMIVIYSTPQSYHPVFSENPVMKSDNTFNQWMLDKILRAFKINSSTAHRYTEANGTLVFVENNSTLKLSPDGVLDYTAKEGASDLKVSSTDIYSEICGIADFMDNLNDITTTQKEFNISSISDGAKDSVVDVSFDYVVNGLPVLMQNGEHAVYAQAANGYIQKYTQVLRSYHLRNETLQTPEYITALDIVIAEHANQEENVVIKEMYTGYFDDGSVGEKYADWHIEVMQ